MMEFLKEWQPFFRALYLAMFVATGVFAVRAWAKRGFRIPRYVHVLAFLAFVVAVGLVWLGRDVGDMSDRTALLFLVGFPLFVYVYFVLHGGAMHGARHERRPASSTTTIVELPNAETARMQRMAEQSHPLDAYKDARQ
jgi:hypothetical protein